MERCSNLRPEGPAGGAGLNSNSDAKTALPTDEDVPKRPPAGAKPPSSHVPAANLLAGLWVLAVDDDPDARRLHALILGRAGAAVTTAGGSAEALEHLHRLVGTGRPGVLICDLAMPDEDGFDFIRKVRAAGYGSRHYPALAVTAFARKPWANATLIGGYQANLAKPVDPDDLVAAVAELAGSVLPGAAESHKLG